MKEYLLACLVIISVLGLIDHFSGVRLYRRKRFWLFQLGVAVLTVVCDSVASGSPFVLYSETYVLPYRVLHVPLENILFGFMIIYAPMIVFECLMRKRSLEKG